MSVLHANIHIRWLYLAFAGLCFAGALYVHGITSGWPLPMSHLVKTWASQERIPGDDARITFEQNKRKFLEAGGTIGRWEDRTRHIARTTNGVVAYRSSLGFGVGFLLLALLARGKPRG